MGKPNLAEHPADTCGALTAGGAFLAPLSISAWQAFAWLEFGYWPSLPVMALADGLGMQRPRVDWVGLQQIIDYIYGCPLSLFLFVVLIGLALRLFSVADRNRQRQPN